MSLSERSEPARPPERIELEPFEGDGLRIVVHYAPGARAVLALGRSLLIVIVGFLLAELWLHLHMFFLFLGLPLLLSGHARAELLLGRYVLRSLPVGGLFSGPHELRRAEIESLGIGRGGLWQAFRPELLARLRAGGEVALLQNLARSQAEYVLALALAWQRAEL